MWLKSNQPRHEFIDVVVGETSGITRHGNTSRNVTAPVTLAPIPDGVEIGSAYRGIFFEFGGHITKRGAKVFVGGSVTVKTSAFFSQRFCSTFFICLSPGSNEDDQEHGDQANPK